MYFREGAVLEHSHVTTDNFLQESGKEEAVEQLRLSLALTPKRISSMFFYDDRGSKLFKEITELPEYYIPRTEIPLIRQAAAAMAPRLSDVDIIELGSGDCTKISVFLNEIPRTQLPSVRYIPVDVSFSAIEDSAETLSHSFPDISIRGAVADFVKQFDQIKSSRRCVFCLFGSTLGNLPRHLAVDFCTRLGAHMRPGDAFLLGVDMVKDRAVLHSAYNDSSRVTSRFNLNILRVVNSILGSDFNPKHFAHRAFFNEEQLRIEMHLEALRDMTVTCTVTGDSLFLDKGETIHTENSHKFTKELIRDLARSAGLGISAVHTDANEWFSLVHLEKQQ